jgi:hypothetical protein
VRPRERRRANGFITVSAAIDRLYDAMWGGVKRPEGIADIKKAFRTTTREADGCVLGGLRVSSVGLASWRAKAITQIQNAAFSGTLTVFAVPDPNGPDDGKPTLRHMSPVVVPPAVLARMIGTTVLMPDGTVKRRLPERVTAPKPGLVAGQPNAGALLDALRFGSLAFAAPVQMLASQAARKTAVALTGTAASHPAKANSTEGQALCSEQGHREQD